MEQENKRVFTSQVSLGVAKEIFERVEEECRRRELQMVMALCGPQGNMIAVHRMDHAFLVSFDAAMNKAYTAAALQMPTIELAAAARPSGGLFNADTLAPGKLTLMGGGLPLFYQGEMIGGLGISGGSAEEDHELAMFAAEMLEKILAP